MINIEIHRLLWVSEIGKTNSPLHCWGSFLQGYSFLLTSSSLNGFVGTQFQYNKHWMIRAEFGFLGSRSQIIGGLQYRFGL